VNSTHTVTGREGVKPGEQAPALVFNLVGGGSWDLAAQKPQGFTLIVFYRGHHCPVCRAQLSELNRRIDELEQRGLDVVAVSGDTDELASESKRDWNLDRLTIGYGLPERSMRSWGLFVSAGHESEPERFNEPGLFLIKPDGTVYYEALTSMPWGRPHLDDVLSGVDYVLRSDYPARGEA
jgi:peroxiredoxin